MRISGSELPILPLIPSVDYLPTLAKLRLLKNGTFDFKVVDHLLK